MKKKIVTFLKFVSLSTNQQMFRNLSFEKFSAIQITTAAIQIKRNLQPPISNSLIISVF